MHSDSDLLLIFLSLWLNNNEKKSQSGLFFGFVCNGDDFPVINEVHYLTPSPCSRKKSPFFTLSLFPKRKSLKALGTHNHSERTAQKAGSIHGSAHSRVLLFLSLIRFTVDCLPTPVNTAWCFRPMQSRLLERFLGPDLLHLTPFPQLCPYSIESTAAVF